MFDFTKHVSTRLRLLATPQAEAIPGTTQVPNSAGGFAWAVDHWTRLESQLKKFGKTYESIEEKQQGHGFRDEKASIKFYERLDAFFAHYLAPEGKVKVGKPETIEMPAKK